MANGKEKERNIRTQPDGRGKAENHSDSFDIETAADIQEVLKNLLGGTIKKMIEVERSVTLATGNPHPLHSNLESKERDSFD